MTKRLNALEKNLIQFGDSFFYSKKDEIIYFNS